MAGIQYPKPERVYRVTTDGGQEILLPSVSDIIEQLGLRPSYRYPAKAQRGTAVHEACYYDDHGVLDDESTHPEVVSIIRSYRDWKSKRRYEAQAFEKPYASLALGYGGTVDRLCLVDAVPVLMDIKTGQRYPWHDIQIGLYWMLVGEVERRCLLLYLDESGWSERWIGQPEIEVARSAYVLWRWMNRQGGKHV